MTMPRGVLNPADKLQYPSLHHFVQEACHHRETPGHNENYGSGFRRGSHPLCRFVRPGKRRMETGSPAISVQV